MLRIEGRHRDGVERDKGLIGWRSKAFRCEMQCIIGEVRFRWWMTYAVQLFLQSGSGPKSFVLRGVEIKTSVVELKEGSERQSNRLYSSLLCKLGFWSSISMVTSHQTAIAL